MQDLKERRFSPRFPVVFSAKISPDILGETVNISESGVCLALEKPLSSAMVVPVSLDLPFTSSLETQAEVIWTNPAILKNRYNCGVHFLRPQSSEITKIMDSVKKYNLLDPHFISLTNQMRFEIEAVKEYFDNFDQDNKEEQEQIKFVEANKEKIFNFLTHHFNQIWEIVKNFNAEEFTLHQQYYQKMLGHFLIDPIETNRYILQKPLGYAGDFIMMIYIYNYNKGKYLGRPSFEKLINNYTCNIPISISNMRRKEFFKSKILEVARHETKSRILNVGCGPAQELIEIAETDEINKTLVYDCLDFEEKALAYVCKKLSRTDNRSREFLNIRFINTNIYDLIKGKNIDEIKKWKYDFVYCAGVFDYLSNRISMRLIEILYTLLADNGDLIICNADSATESHRAYYEMLGDWKFSHRTKEELLEWTKHIKDALKIYFEDVGEKNNYLFLHIEKK